MKTAFVLAAVFVSLSLALLIEGWSFKAQAQQGVCLPHDIVMSRLAKNHQEHPVAIGLAGNGRILEVFAKQDGSKWTIVMTTPNGLSCLVAAGEAWEIVPSTIHSKEKSL